MIKIEEFLPIHFTWLKDIHKKHESPTEPFLSLETLPKIGFIVSDNERYIAAGFLRKLEGGYGQIDTYVTNPEVSSEDRHKALELLTETLVKEAKVLEMRAIYALSADISVITRAVATGFQLLSECIVGLSLR